MNSMSLYEYARAVKAKKVTGEMNVWFDETYSMSARLEFVRGINIVMNKLYNPSDGFLNEYALDVKKSDDRRLTANHRNEYTQLSLDAMYDYRKVMGKIACFGLLGFKIAYYNFSEKMFSEVFVKTSLYIEVKEVEMECYKQTDKYKAIMMVFVLDNIYDCALNSTCCDALVDGAISSSDLSAVNAFNTTIKNVYANPTDEMIFELTNARPQTMYAINMAKDLYHILSNHTLERNIEILNSNLRTGGLTWATWAFLRNKAKYMSYRGEFGSICIGCLLNSNYNEIIKLAIGDYVYVARLFRHLVKAENYRIINLGIGLRYTNYEECIFVYDDKTVEIYPHEVTSRILDNNNLHIASDVYISIRDDEEVSWERRLN